MSIDGDTLVTKAEFQNKVNNASLRNVHGLRDKVVQLELDEFGLIQPRVHGMKYLTELLDNLRYRTERLHATEQTLLEKEMLIRDMKLHNGTSFGKRRGEYLFRTEADYSRKLGRHVQRLSHQIQELLRCKERNRLAPNNEIMVIQTVLMERSEEKKTQMEELDRELKKVKDEDTKAVETLWAARREQVALAQDEIVEQTNPEDVVNANDTMKEEIESAKMLLNDPAFKEMGSVSSGVIKRNEEKIVSLKNEYKKVYSEFVGISEDLERQKLIMQQKDADLKSVSLKEVELKQRIDTQTGYLTELLQNDETYQSKLLSYDGRLKILQRRESNSLALEKVLESLKYVKKELSRMEEDLAKQTIYHVDLVKKLDYEKRRGAAMQKAEVKNGDRVGEEMEKLNLKQTLKKLAEEFKRKSEEEKKKKELKVQRLQHLEELAKENRSCEERLEARKVEWRKSNKMTKDLAADFENAVKLSDDGAKSFEATQATVMDMQEQGGLLKDEIKDLKERLASAAENYEELKKTIIETAKSMSGVVTAEQKPRKGWWESIFG
ncbi:putative uncharacterized protein MYH16 [Neocloeon triangulifer]|uniref:putative uncharacterized protein MYH16 n=1 Tax=Neocloeon triangulifer TaxID=2078957 RepID=UPI00286F77C1|nr:putative uncharacterized protein MYH16 [Neocloeon triangulifer]